MALSTSITNLAGELAGELNAGRPARVSMGAKGDAFSWLAGMPTTLAQYVATGQVDGLTANVVVVEPSATPVTKVAEGAPKPNAVKFTPTTVQALKYSGYAEFTLEQYLSTAALASVIANVLGAQCVQALEADTIAALEAAGAAGDPVSGTTLQSAVIAAQAQVLSNGGKPSIVVLGTDGYADLVSLGSTGFVVDPTSGPIGTWLGSIVHVSPTVAAGTAYVLDSSAVFIAENEASPVGIINPFSQAKSNKVELILDVIAAPVVVAPGLVVKATKTA
jgi:hypothetical protein